MSRISLSLSAALLAASLPLGAQERPSQERPFYLDGLIVTASPTPRASGDVARFVTVLQGTDLRERGLTRVVDALRDVPGLSVVQGGSPGAATSVFLRGGESDYVQVLVDGVQVNSPGGAFDFAGLTLENVERIEVARGPASSLYGSDAMAGVIHVITRTGRGETGGTLALRGGNLGRREAALTLSGGGTGLGWSLGLSHHAGDGVYDLNSGFENNVATGNVRLAPDDRTRAAVSLRMADRTYRFPTDGAGVISDANQFTFGDEVSAAVSASRVVTEGLEVRGAVTLARTDGGTDDQPDAAGDTLGYYGFTSLDHIQRTTADVRANLYRGPLVATVGAEWEEEKQRSFSESLSEWGATPGRSEYRRDNRAGYAHLTGASGAASFAAGLRLEDNERFGRSTTWNAEAGWELGSGLVLRAAGGVAVKEPTFYENYAQGWVRGNPDLDPERSRSVEVGATQSLPGGIGSIRATAFSQRFEDLIQYVAVTAVPGDPNFQNVASASSRGMEVGVGLHVGRVRGEADWTWLDTEVLDAGVDEGPDADFVAGGRLLRRPTHQLHVRGAVDVAGGSASLDVRMVGEREDRDYATWPAVRKTLPRYTTVGLGGAFPVAEGVALTVRGENLLDVRYQEIVGFPAPGRTVVVGARLTFGGP